MKRFAKQIASVDYAKNTLEVDENNETIADFDNSKYKIVNKTLKRLNV